MERWKVFRSYITHIFKGAGGWVFAAIGAIGFGGALLGSLGYEIPNIPLWVWVLMLAVGLIMAPFQLYKKQTEEINRLTPKNGSDKPEATLYEKLELLVEEGKDLRRLSVAMGEKPPTMKAENWRIRVRELLAGEFGRPYGDRWNTHSINCNNKQFFNGMGTPAQIKLWEGLTAGIEKLEEIWQQTK